MKPGKKITVLIADDSSFSRRVLRVVLENDPLFHIIGEASTGMEAIQMAEQFKPRLITMDLDMPEINGLDAIEHIMEHCPTRILVVTGMPSYGGLDSYFEALTRGALDLVPKTDSLTSTKQEQYDIIELSKRLATIPVERHDKSSRGKRARDRIKQIVTGQQITRREGLSIVAIGSSTGGPSVLKDILRMLPKEFPVPIVIVQHLTDMFVSGFIDWLNSSSSLKVREALPGMWLEPSTVYLASRGSHITMTKRGCFGTSYDPPRNSFCPSIDVFFESVSQIFGDKAVGILLTGMGKDGAHGLKAIADAGGTTLVQNKKTSTVFGMAKVAIELGAAQHVVPFQEIPRVLLYLTARMRPNTI